MVGLFGELLILAAFVACVLSGVAYFRAARRPAEAAAWEGIGRKLWYLSLGTLAASFFVLVGLLVTGQFEYAYVHQQTSLALPLKYKISAAWAGQEGSFLFWALMASAVGALFAWQVSRTQGVPEERLAARRVLGAPAMVFLALSQAFLLSMLLGLQIGPVGIGATPFLTLAEKFPEAPFVLAGTTPPDGSGLNELLQNPWMVIHPPMTFLGFVLLGIPFALALAGLWKRRYTQWVRPALPWALAGGGILGLAIVMGGYWAYVTLSFGGFWAWDPVENAALVPWLFSVAGLHAMLIQKRTAAGHKSALFLTATAYLMAVYETFLTRSGILGDISVHSFVDLGLYNQLLAWIATMTIVSTALAASRWRDLPVPARPPAALSRENMIFGGALLLALTGLVIILGTSAPIIGRLFRDNPAAVPVSFYNDWTLPLAVGVTFLAGLGQLFWWRRMTPDQVSRALFAPLVLTVVCTAAVLMVTPFTQMTVGPPAVPAGPVVAEAGLFSGVGAFWDRFGTSLLLLLLVFSAFFALFGNGSVLFRLAKGNLKMAGGTLTHVGFALLILGIVASSAFNDPISDGDGANLGGSRENFILETGEQRSVDGWLVGYTGEELGPDGKPAYVLSFTSPSGEAFTARPVVYRDAGEQVIQRPHVQKALLGDVYIAAYPSWMSEDADAEASEVVIQRGDSTALGDDYALAFRGYDLDIDYATAGIDPDAVEIAVAAVLDVTHRASGETRRLRPVYVVDPDGRAQFIQNRVEDWGMTVTFTGMMIEDDAIRLVIEGVDLTREWVLVQASRKPLISLVWIGTILVTLGFGIAFARRRGVA